MTDRACSKCGSTKNLEEIQIPYTHDDPGYSDDICSDCIKLAAEDEDSVLLSCPQCQEQLQPGQLAAHFRSHEL